MGLNDFRENLNIHFNYLSKKKGGSRKKRRPRKTRRVKHKKLRHKKSVRRRRKHRVSMKKKKQKGGKKTIKTQESVPILAEQLQKIKVKKSTPTKQPKETTDDFVSNTNTEIMKLNKKLNEHIYSPYPHTTLEVKR